MPCPDPKYKHVVPGSGNRPFFEAFSNPAPSLEDRGFHCRHSFFPSRLRRSPRRLTPLTAFLDQRLRPSIRTRSEKEITDSPLASACSNLANLLLDFGDFLRGPCYPSKMVDTCGNDYLSSQHSSNGSPRPLWTSANPRMLEYMAMLRSARSLP